MVPTSTVNATALFSTASEVVGNFGALVLLVGGIALGVWGVRFLIKRIRAAR